MAHEEHLRSEPRKETRLYFQKPLRGAGRKSSEERGDDEERQQSVDDKTGPRHLLDEPGSREAIDVLGEVVDRSELAYAPLDDRPRARVVGCDENE